MALKYKIVYGNDTRYRQPRRIHTVARYLAAVFLCIVVVILAVLPPVKNKLYDLFLPGSPAVTSDALCQLAEALGRGEALTDALDVFCNTVMETR